MFVLCFTKWSIFAKHHSSTLSCQTDSWQANNQNLSAVPTLLRRQRARQTVVISQSIAALYSQRACSRALCQFVSFVYWLWKWQGMARINHWSKWEMIALMRDHPSSESTLSDIFPFLCPCEQTPADQWPKFDWDRYCRLFWVVLLSVSLYSPQLIVSVLKSATTKMPLHIWAKKYIICCIKWTVHFD